MKRESSSFKFAFFIVFTLWVVSCKQNQTQQETQGLFFSRDTVYIEKDNPLLSGLSIVTVNEALFSKQIEAVGKIAADPTRMAYISIPFSGRAVKSYVRIGQKVEEGAPLFEIVSSEFISAQKEFFKAQSERELALKDLNRKEELQKNGIASRRELEEAVNTFKIADKEYDNAVATIKIFRVDPEKMIMGQPLIIRSSIAGEVIENNVVIGQYFKDDDRYAMIVANLQKVWIRAYINEKDIRFVQLGDRVAIHVEAQPEKQLEGKIFHIADIIDEETRTVNVLIESDNHERLLKAGMFATAVIKTIAQNRIIVPETAILQDEKYSYVFVKTGETSFVKRQVKVETTSEGNAILSSGLETGEQIIEKGAFQLN